MNKPTREETMHKLNSAKTMDSQEGRLKSPQKLKSSYPEKQLNQDQIKSTENPVHKPQISKNPASKTQLFIGGYPAP